MQEITKREAEALEAGDEDQVRRLQRGQGEFLSQHLGRWAPGFCQKVEDRAELPFYKTMARLTKDFILSEAGELATEC